MAPGKDHFSDVQYCIYADTVGPKKSENVQT